MSEAVTVRAVGAEKNQHFISRVFLSEVRSFQCRFTLLPSGLTSVWCRLAPLRSQFIFFRHRSNISDRAYSFFATLRLCGNRHPSVLERTKRLFPQRRKVRRVLKRHNQTDPLPMLSFGSTVMVRKLARRTRPGAAPLIRETNFCCV